MTYEQYKDRCRSLQDDYDIVNLKEKVCSERVDYLVDLCNVKSDYIAQLREENDQLKVQLVMRYK